MLNVPAKFVLGCIQAYEQTCKRAKNCLESLGQTRYVVEKKKRWFGKDYYNVNVFGDHQLKHGSMDNVLEHLLSEDKISTLDYQLLKFYDVSLEVNAVIEEILVREKLDNSLIKISNTEMQLLNEISTFVENEGLTKEEILDGFNL